MRMVRQNISGVCATIGGILIHLTLGNLYSFGMELEGSWFNCFVCFMLSYHDISVLLH